MVNLQRSDTVQHRTEPWNLRKNQPTSSEEEQSTIDLACQSDQAQNFLQLPNYRFPIQGNRIIRTES